MEKHGSVAIIPIFSVFRMGKVTKLIDSLLSKHTLSPHITSMTSGYI